MGQFSVAFNSQGMANAGSILTTRPKGAAVAYPTGSDAKPRQREALREAAMLWAIRGGMVGYGLIMSLAAESIILTLRSLF